MKRLSARDIVGAVAIIVVVVLLVAVLWRAEPRVEAVADSDVVIEMADSTPCDSVHLAPFDPNTVEYEQLRAIGMSRQEAVSLLKFRASGKVFRIVEDVALCYAISDSAFSVLKPYITIGEEYRIKPRTEYSHSGGGGYSKKTPTTGRVKSVELSRFRIDTVTVKYLRATGLFTKRQAEAVVRWRDRSGFRDMEELRACYVVDDSVATALEPYVIFPEPDAADVVCPVEINSADSAALRGVVGIGERSVVAIIEYRELLGGFISVEQLAEIRVITRDNYLRIASQVLCDANRVRRMNINTVSADRLRLHPYVSQSMFRTLLKHRSKGRTWKSIDELLADGVVSEEEAQRLAPYLEF